MSRDRPKKQDAYEEEEPNLTGANIRIPKALRPYLAALLEKEERKKTDIFLRALDLYANHFGHEWPRKPPK